MAKLYKNRFRVKSARCPNWDYGSRGAYFITICTKGRVKYFGTIKNGCMKLSDAGKIAERCWDELPEHFPNIVIDEFVIMPNHVHGIIIIVKNISSGSKDSIENSQSMSSISPKSGSIGSIIRSYKSACSCKINRASPALEFNWQPRFYDIIIRNHLSFERIQRYIQTNPMNWKEDMFNKK
jgi:putative transposase